MAWGTSPVQEKASDAWTAGTSFTITLTGSPTDGNFGVIYYDAAGAALSITSISQSGATWAAAEQANNGSRVAEIWYTTALFSGAGTSITINLSGTPTASNIQSAAFSEWTPPASIALDAIGANFGTSTTPTTATITPTASKNALIIAGGRLATGTPTGPTNGFTALTSADGIRGYGAYLVVASTSGSYSTGWTTALGVWGTAIAAFIDNSGGASTLVRRTLGDLGTRAGSRQAM